MYEPLGSLGMVLKPPRAFFYSLEPVLKAPDVRASWLVGNGSESLYAFRSRRTGVG